jgi:hypothetical protein
MEWPPRSHPGFPCRSAARLSDEIQKTRLCFDVLLLRGGDLATHPWGAHFLWTPRDAAHRIVPVSSRRGCAGVALGFALHARTRKSHIVCANVHSAHRAPAARNHRLGFASSFRRSSFPRLEMVWPGTNHRVSKSLPFQASTERRVFDVLRFCLSLPVHATAAPCRMGSGQHKLWGLRPGRHRFHD